MSDPTAYSRRPRAGCARPWRAPVAAGPLDAAVPLPGSKSLTNRELILAALADGPSRCAPRCTPTTRRG